MPYNNAGPSSLNIATGTLGNGASYTGQWEDVAGYGSITVAIKTDQNGTYSVQFSPDGVNQDSTLTRYYRTTQIEPPHRFTVTRRYMRVVFTNDSGSNQTYFRLHVLLGDRGDLNAPMDSVLSQDFDATVVRPTNPAYEIALGQRQGQTTWNKWGYNADVDLAAAETVWSVGGLFVHLTSAETITVVSASVDDTTSTGTGAQSIVVYGIDANRKSQIEVIQMTGQTPVITTSTWLGINRASIYLAGAGGVNAGNITITATTATTNQAQIPASEGSTQHAFFFTQAGHTALMDWVLINVNKISGGGTPVVTIKGWVTSFVSGAKYEVFRHVIDTGVENTVQIMPSQPFVVGEKSLLAWEATTTVNDTVVSLRFSFVEVRAVSAT